MRAYVEYSVPVLALVDTETGTVERVIEVVEEIRPVRVDGRVQVVAARGDDEPGEALSMVAGAIAFTVAESAEWPAWGAGF